MRPLADVRRATVRPVVEGGVAEGALVHADGCGVHARLQGWGHGHETGRHARGEDARDGDGFRAVHVDTAEGPWPPLRARLRPHRGVARDEPPACLGCVRLARNARRRGKAPLGTLVAGSVARAGAHHPETRQEPPAGHELAVPAYTDGPNS